MISVKNIIREKEFLVYVVSSNVNSILQRKIGDRLFLGFKDDIVWIIIRQKLIEQTV